jgi:hypothetical protein
MEAITCGLKFCSSCTALGLKFQALEQEGLQLRLAANASFHDRLFDILYVDTQAELVQV